MEHSQLVGVTLNGVYRLVRRITSGGMGSIFEAEHLRLGKRYAVKVLHAVHNPVAMQRFQREALITSDLGHDHIVEVHDFNLADDGMPYIVMELLEGEDLGRRLRRGQMPLDQVVRIAQQVAAGLDAAHGEGVVHRDLKPHNIFLCKRSSSEDFVKILDFGVSKVRDAAQVITKENTLTGTPNYMSPEQAEGMVADVDHRTDIFALGVVLYECLTGTRPFDAPTVSGTLYQVVHRDPSPVHRVRPDVPEQVDAVLRIAMAKDKKARQSSATQLAKQLAEASVHARAHSTTGPISVISTPEPDTQVEITREQTKRRVLFVDDSPSIRALVSAWLTQSGYDVVLAHDGDEGASKVLEVRPDLVIADVNMPRRDGFALCRTIKEDPLISSTPVILFTRLDEATDIVNGLASGADAFVVKGSGAKDLLRQVEGLLPGASPQRRRHAAIASLENRPNLGRKAIFKRLFDAFFREVPFDILALLVTVGNRDLILLGSHYELSNAVADELTEQIVEAYGSLSGNLRPREMLDSQRIVIDETSMWGDAEASLQRSVMVPMLDGGNVIGCLGVFSFEDNPALDANIRFFFDIGVAAARALRGRSDER